jgi:hypothetical protein
MKTRKFDYLIIGQGRYGQGWEDETAYNDDAAGRKESRADLKAYRQNSAYPFRLIRRRELRAV